MKQNNKDPFKGRRFTEGGSCGRSAEICRSWSAIVNSNACSLSVMIRWTTPPSFLGSKLSPALEKRIGPHLPMASRSWRVEET